MAVRKLAVSMPDELVQRLDAYARNNCVSRSGVMSMACKQWLDAQELMPAYKRLVDQANDAVERVMSGRDVESGKRDMDLVLAGLAHMQGQLSH